MAGVEEVGCWVCGWEEVSGAFVFVSTSACPPSHPLTTNVAHAEHVGVNGGGGQELDLGRFEGVAFVEADAQAGLGGGGKRWEGGRA